MHKIVLILVILTINISCKAQESRINSLELQINGVSYLNKDISLVIQNLGNPQKIADYYFEMDAIMAKKYYYDGLLFYAINEKIESFEITHNSYLFTSNNIKVGDHIKSLKAIYPLSYQNKNNGDLSIFLNDIDQFILISYDNTNGLISKISLQSF